MNIKVILLVGILIFNTNLVLGNNLFKREYFRVEKYCSKLPLHSSSEISKCYYEQLNSKGYGNQYLKIREECYSPTKTTYDIWKCVEDKICQD